VPDDYGTRIEALMDLIRFGPEAMKNSEFLALLFHVERSLGYGKQADAASLSQMSRGVYEKKTGKRIRGAAGISKPSCARANASLEKKGLIRRVRRYRENGGCDSTEYEVQWPELLKFFVKIMPPKDADPCLTMRQAPVSPRDTLPVSERDSPYLTVRQEQRRSYRGNHHQRESKQKRAHSESAGVVEPPRVDASHKPTGANPSQSAPEPERVPKTLLADDDVDPTPRVRERLASPEQEFLVRLRERGHATGDDAIHVLKSVRKQLDKRGLTLDSFLSYEAPRATGRSHTPAAMYTQLVKEWKTDRDSFEFNRQAELTKALTSGMKETFVNHCPHCAKSPHGKGVRTNENGEYEACECASSAVAELIAMLETRRKATAGSETAAKADKAVA
jgi:hypothetical protein